MTPINKKWAQKTADEFEEREHETSNYDWFAYFGNIRIKGLNDKTFVQLHIAGGVTILPHIKTIEQVELLISLLSDRPAKILTGNEILSNILLKGEEKNEYGMAVAITKKLRTTKGFTTYLRYDSVVKEINKQLKWKKRKSVKQ